MPITMALPTRPSPTERAVRGRRQASTPSATRVASSPRSHSSPSPFPYRCARARSRGANRCCAVIAARAAVCLAGNHDLAVIGVLSVDEFNGDAAAAARWTREVLEPEARGFLEALEPAATRPGAELFHGSPIDPVWD